MLTAHRAVSWQVPGRKLKADYEESAVREGSDQVLVGKIKPSPQAAALEPAMGVCGEEHSGTRNSRAEAARLEHARGTEAWQGGLSNRQEGAWVGYLRGGDRSGEDSRFLSRRAGQPIWAQGTRASACAPLLPPTEPSSWLP